MTSAGKELFDESVFRHTTEIAALKRNIDCFASQCMEQGVNISAIEKTEEQISELFKRFDKAVQTYRKFLEDHRTAESETEMNSLQEISSSVAKSVAVFTLHLNSLRSKIPQDKSRASKGSKAGKSSLSRVSSKLTQTLIQHTTKVEQARARMKYAEEEAELIKQEAAIKASRTVLTCKKELEAAKQGLDAVRKVLDFSDVEESVFGEYESHHESQDHPDLTERYVMENVKIDIPPPDPVVNEYIPSAAMENTHNNPESELQRNSLNPVVPPEQYL